MESQEPPYVSGFNTGYLLAEHEPNLLNSIVPSLHPTNEYLEGLLDGKQELELVKAKNSLLELGQIRNRNLDKSKNLDREQ